MSAVSLSHMWYVKAAGGVWGPYPEARVAAFVAEGRVGVATPLSPWAQGPFAPALEHREFQALLRRQASAASEPELASRPMAVQPAAPKPPASGPSPAHPSAPGASAPSLSPGPPAPRPLTPRAALLAAPAATASGPPAAAAAPSRPHLVWARLAEGSVAAFHQALAATGEGVTLSPGLWLVQAAEGSAALRNRLSRALGPADRMLVVEAPLEGAAWFNLDPAQDRAARRLWQASSRTAATGARAAG